MPGPRGSRRAEHFPARPGVYESRREAIYRRHPRYGESVRAGHRIQRDYGAFYEPPTDFVRGFPLDGPVVIPVTEFIDDQTRSMRPARKQLLGEGKRARMAAEGCKGPIPW